MNAVEALFPSPTLVSILALLLINPDEEYYQLEISQKTGFALLQVQNALKRIVKSGIATASGRGRMVYYRANRESPIFEDMKRLLLKTVAVGELIRQGIKALEADKVQQAFIFGSYAKGEEAAHSDIDLFILGNLSLMEISEVIGPVSETTGREVNPVIYSREEFQARLKARNHFIEDLLTSPKIWLIGSENEFKAMAE